MSKGQHLGRREVKGTDIGSHAHKELFCRSFIDSHREYTPEDLPWPQLDEIALQRLRSIPFWEEALHTEQEAGAMVNAYAATAPDPLVHEAIALQGWEETRHARLLQCMMRHYSIEVAERPRTSLPGRIESAFVTFGYTECLDAFLTFGLFQLVRQSGLFPESLFTLFDCVMEEEARHIVFFINWVAYLQANRGRIASTLRAAHALWYYSRALRDLARVIGEGDKGGENFVATGASSFIENLTPTMVLSACLEENARRMRSFDARLLQPRFMPALARVGLRVLQFRPSGKICTPRESRLSESRRS